MPNCVIVKCGAYKNKNHPQLTLHIFPKNDALRKRWLESIGEENINPRHKNWYVCSLHFEESCFNRTLDVIRLHDNSVPTIFTERRQVTSNPLQNIVLRETDNIQKDVGTASAVLASSHLIHQNVETTHKEILETGKIRVLQEKCNKQKQKIKRLNEKIRKKNKKIANLKDIIEDLRRQNRINAEQAVLIEELAGPEDFLKRQIFKSKGLPLPNKYSEEIRKFALNLHFLSPKAYDYVRRTYNTCLPHSRTLSKWYQHVNAEPGFTKEAFDTLKIKVQGNAQPVICSLVFDEMAIRKSLTWDPRAQKYYGRIDYGHNIDNDCIDEASQALVILLTSINGTWKLPIGYFLIKSLTGEQKSVIVETALKLCEDVGVKVVTITCDGPSTNFSMFASLGCDVLRNQDITTFDRGNTRIHIFIDPCHCIKLIRNAFGELRVFIDSFGRRVDFKYLEELLELQEKQGLHLANKLKKAHLLFQKQKMKVKLATQLLSSSVADALDYCCTELKLKQFEDCSGTINFINIMNDVFDVLNSHSIRPPGHKKAMYPGNIGLITALFEGTTAYLKSLRLPSGKLLINSRRKTGFIGLLIDMKSALSLYYYLIEDTQMLKYIPLYKVSQDHLELFFSAVRARGGFNNNPNAVQFRAAYKKLLIKAEIKDEGLGNCIPLEQVNILTCSSKNPIQVLNQLTEKNTMVEIPEDHSDLYDDYLESVLNSSTDIYTEKVVQYISGFIIKKLTQSIKCDICVSLLTGEEDVKSLIYKKSRGGLKYASSCVNDILQKTENILKRHIDEKANLELYYLYVFKFMSEFCNVEKFFCDSDPEHASNHKLLLIKIVIKTYLDLRFKYYGKKKTEKVSKRQFYNKLTLFRNE